MNSRRAKIHAHWAMFMGVYYASLCYVEALQGMDLPTLAPINLSLSAVVAGLMIQMMGKAKKNR